MSKRTFITILCGLLVFKLTCAIPECANKRAEIFFLLDSSSSIWRVHYDLQLKFVSQVVEYLDIGSDRVRVGAAIFSTRYVPQIRLDSFYDKASLQGAILNIPYLSGETYTDIAIKAMREEGLADVRRDVVKIGVVLTDGRSHYMAKTVSESAATKASGVVMFAVGIGSSVDRRELAAIASEPRERYVIQVGNFNLLDKFKDELATKICQTKLPPADENEPECGRGKRTDIMFLFDAAAMGTTKVGVIQDFVADVIQEFNMAQDATHVGILSSNLHHDDIKLNMYLDRNSLGKDLRSRDYPELSQLVRNLRLYSFNPANGGRSGAHKMAVLFLDERLRNPAKMMAEILRAKYVNIEIVVVTIGSQYDKSEVLRIATSQNHVISIPSFQTLAKSKEAFVRKFCSFVCACTEEVEALTLAAHIISTRQENCSHVVFQTYALSALQALENNKLDRLSEALHPISSVNQVVLQWIPAHCGIPGNENADRLAKLGAAKEQEDNWVIYEEMKSHIKSLYRPPKQTNDYYLLSRQEQVIIFRLRTGYNRLNQHMHKRFRLVPSSICSCGEAEQTTEHVIQDCINLQSTRKTQLQTIKTVTAREADPDSQNSELEITCVCHPAVGIMNTISSVLCFLTWVTIPEHSYSIPVKQPKCREKVADIIFALDSSSSIWEDDFKQQLNFVANVANSFILGQNNIQVGVVTFGSDVRLDFHLNAHTSPTDLMAALKNISYLGGGTNTGSAIRYIRKEMFREKHGGRPWAAKILVLVTDGLSQNTTSTLMEASFAHYNNIEVFAIGVGGGVDDFELRSITSEPSETHVFRVDGYEALDAIRTTIEQRTCERPSKDHPPGSVKEEPADTPTERCGGKPADVYFVLDASSSIWPPDFATQVDFVKAVIDTFDLGANKTRVGVITYSDGVHVQVPLGSTYDRTELKSRIETTPFLTGRTNTGGVIEYLTDVAFSHDVARHGAAHVAIILTDGQSSKLPETVRQAARAHERGIYLFSVGIGQQTDVYELMAIASDPDEDFVFKVDDFDGLTKITDLLAIKTCNVEVPEFPNDQPDSCNWKRPSDIVFVFDTASIGRRHSDVIENVISHVVHKLNISQKSNHFGILRDNFPDTGNVGLSEFFEPEAFAKSTKYSKFHTLQPLLHNMRRFSFHPAFGGRPHVQKKAVIFVDDKLYNSKETLLEAERAKFKNIKIFVVAVGGHCKRKELQAMCSKPANQHLLHVESYAHLRLQSDEIADMLCQGSRSSNR
ncbi:uncharacterized protein LOC121379208 [Gigantopelta aegis]|uniref:uncharacterized protein LOC121379208 n=1 Tax=Gigantopelta aegis TaxID=1735272 RepID=UPI001B888CA8|nr:uncharacterized protein LOC121379208 [Gigantopelta aegis]